MQCIDINKFIQTRFSRLQRYRKKIGRKGNEEAIHHFRVEVKKLSALLRLLATAGQGLAPSLPVPLKKMYKALGKIRDAQLCRQQLQQKLKHNQHPFDFSDAEKNVSWRKKVLSAVELDALEKKLLNEVNGGLPSEIVKQFFNRQKQAVTQQVQQKKYSDEALHSVRKMLKDILYVSADLKEFPSVLADAGIDKNSITKLEKLTRLLGSYNDLCNMLSFVKLLIKEERDAAQKALLISIRQECTREKRNLRRKIIRALQPPLFSSIT